MCGVLLAGLTILKANNMEQYIPKSALLAEMKKKIELYIDTSVQLGFDKCCSVHYLRGRKEQCEEVISLLDTLEVKEVTSIDTDCRNCDTDYDGD